MLISKIQQLYFVWFSYITQMDTVRLKPIFRWESVGSNSKKFLKYSIFKYTVFQINMTSCVFMFFISIRLFPKFV